MSVSRFADFSRIAAAAGLALLAAGLPLRSDAGAPECSLPSEFVAADADLPKTASALKAGSKVKIVVIGGGSTAGGAVGGGDLAYPGRLAAAMRARFPGSNIVVVNKGVARQTAHDMAARFDRDVIAEQPVLVVWETGIADSVRGVEVDEFRETIDEGIQKLHSAGVEVVLVDTQFMRRANVVMATERYDLTLREVADIRRVPLFRRNELMRHWAEYGIFTYEETNEKDRRAMIARVYDCVGRALADFVARAFPPPVAGK
jgi:hypothetical protein